MKEIIVRLKILVTFKHYHGQWLEKKVLVSLLLDKSNIHFGVLHLEGQLRCVY